MRLTVKQLKGLIKEALIEAHDDGIGIVSGDRQEYLGMKQGSPYKASPKQIRIARKAVRELANKSVEEVHNDIVNSLGAPTNDREAEAMDSAFHDVLAAIKDINQDAYAELAAAHRSMKKSDKAARSAHFGADRRY